MKIENIPNRLLYTIYSDVIKESLDDANNRHNTICILEDTLENTKDYGLLNDIIHEFAKIFKDSFTENQLQSMYYRLNRLSVVDKDGKTKKRDNDIRLGSYNAFYNRMSLYHYKDENREELKRNVIFHELLHMSSSRSTVEGSLSGFETGVVGTELNEGYTEYLRMKYFTKEDYTKSYDWRIAIVKGLEYLVGEKEMENFYFNADLSGLIRELEKYSSKEDIMKLLFLMDRVETNNFSIKKYKQVLNEIAKMNQKKLDRCLGNRMITPNQYDMMSALKVEELKHGRIWSEHSKFSTDGHSFIIIDQDNHNSPLYELKTNLKKNIQKVQI